MFLKHRTSYWRVWLVMAFACVTTCVARATLAEESSSAPVQAEASADSQTDTSVATDDASQPVKEQQSGTSESVQEDVNKGVEEKTAKQREKLVEEAVSAVQMTRETLASLDHDNPEEALQTLAKITGKLELLVARNPNLALIPVGVTTTIYDVFAEVETIESIVEKAQEALDDGDVQTARRLLNNLASEVVISTTQLPLATYPDAIKRVAPLIDEGRIDEAKQQLQSALNLLVVTDVIYPLPDLRAQEMLKEAQKLSEKSDRSNEENQRLEELLTEVRSQVEFGLKLGYFTEDNAESIYDELDQIEDKTSEGKSGSGFFEKIKGLFD